MLFGLFGEGNCEDVEAVRNMRWRLLPHHTSSYRCTMFLGGLSAHTPPEGEVKIETQHGTCLNLVAKQDLLQWVRTNINQPFSQAIYFQEVIC